MAIKQITYKIDFEVVRASQNLDVLKNKLQSVTNDSVSTSSKILDQTKQTAKLYEDQTKSINNLAEQRKRANESANASGAVKGVNTELDKALDKMGKLATGSAFTFTEMAKGAAATMGAFSAVNAITDSIRAGFNSAVETEKFETALEVMLGSADKAKAKVAELTTFAAKTPLEMPGIQDSANTLLAFGIDADKLIPTMKSLGDVARGDEVAFRRLSLIFGQARATGRVMTGDLNQLANLGVPILRQLAQNFGVTESQVRTLAEAGKIGFADLEKAIGQMSGVGGQFNNMMERMSEKTAGKLSTLADSFRIAMAETVRLVFPIINILIDWAGVAITKFSAFVMFLAGMPKFIKENRTVFFLLLTAMIALNGQLIISTALMLKDLAVRKLVAIETRILTAQQWLYNAALSANPIGLVVAGMAALLAITVALTSATRDLLDSERARKDITDEMNEATEKERATYELLFNELKDVNTESERRVEIINQINAQYGEYLGYQLQEHDNLLIIAEAQEGVNRAIRNNMLLKMQQTQTQQAMEQMLEAEKEYIKMIREDSSLSDAQKKQKISEFKEYQRLTILNAQESKKIGSIQNKREQLEFDKQALASLEKNILTKEQLSKLDETRTAKQKEYNKTVSQYGADSQAAQLVRKELERAEGAYSAGIKHNEINKKNIDNLRSSTQQWTKEINTANTQVRQSSGESMENMSKEYELRKKITDDTNPFAYLASLVGYTNTQTGAIVNSLEATKEYAEAQSLMTDMQEGVTHATTRNTEAVRQNAGATGELVKAKEYQLELIKADTEAIEENSKALRQNRKELEEEIALRDKMRDPVQLAIADAEKLTKKNREEAQKRVEDAKKALDKQLADREADIRKQNEQAKAKIAEAQFEGGKNAPKVIAEFSTLADDAKMNEQLSKLKTNYLDELAKITKASNDQIVALEENAYIQRVNSLDLYLRQQLDKYKQSKVDLEELVFDIQYNLLSAEHRSYNDRLKAVDMLHKKQLDKENEKTNELIKTVRDNEIKLSQVRAGEASTRIQLNRTDLTDGERKAFEEKLRLQKLEGDSYEALLNTNRTNLQKSLQEQYKIEQDYFVRLADLYVQEAEKLTEAQISGFNHQLEVNRLYKNKTFALAQSLRDDLTKFENTDNARRLQNEINALENRLRAYRSFGVAYNERRKMLEEDLKTAQHENDQERVIQVQEQLWKEDRAYVAHAEKIKDLEREKTKAREEQDLVREALIDDQIAKEQDYAAKALETTKQLEAELAKARAEGDKEQVARLEARLKAEQDLQKRYGDKEQETEQQIEKNKAQLESDKADRRREMFLTTVNGIAELSNATIQGIRQVWEAETAIVDKLIEHQTDAVAKAREKANESKEQGDAEFLQMEEERLDKLNKQKEAYVARQRVLATIEMIIQTGVLIARAAAEGGGIASAFTIAAALASLTFGLIAGRQIAESSSSGFRFGGDTGDETVAKTGRPIYSTDPDAVGVVHKNEFVFTEEEYKKFGDYFHKIRAGKLDLREWERERPLSNILKRSQVGIPIASNVSRELIRSEVLKTLSQERGNAMVRLSGQVTPTINRELVQHLVTNQITLQTDTTRQEEELRQLRKEVQHLSEIVGNLAPVHLHMDSDVAEAMQSKTNRTNRIKNISK